MPSLLAPAAKAGNGAAIACSLARDWDAVFITYYRPYDHESGLVYSPNPDDPQELLAELRGLGCQAEGLEVDLSDPTAPARLFETVEHTLGPVQVLVNNATYSMQGGIDALTAEQLDRTYAVNLRGMALMCVEFVRRYRKALGEHTDAAGTTSTFGRIVNLTSGQSLGPMPGELAYAATKGAVEAFTLSLSAEVASLGITVNAVDLGRYRYWLDSRLTQSAMGIPGAPRLWRLTMPLDLIRFSLSQKPAMARAWSAFAMEAFWSRRLRWRELAAVRYSTQRIHTSRESYARTICRRIDLGGGGGRCIVVDTETSTAVMSSQAGITLPRLGVLALGLDLRCRPRLVLSERCPARPPCPPVLPRRIACRHRLDAPRHGRHRCRWIPVPLPRCAPGSLPSSEANDRGERSTGAQTLGPTRSSPAYACSAR